MTTNTLPEPAATLGGFLRNRRSRLQPDAADQARRRTPGLRREEIAVRAGVSVVWYTWLEQGRGGPPSVEVLEKLSHALELDSAGRELLFLLAQHRPPPLTVAPAPTVPPSLQPVLDAMPTSPAFVKTLTWDIVAWNRAAAAVLADFGALPVQERNVLRRVFCDAGAQPMLPDLEQYARFVVSVFRMNVARAGGCPEADALVAELQTTSPHFRRLWAENDVSNHEGGAKRIERPQVGVVTLRYSAFEVNGADGLTMVVLTPASPADADAVETLLAHSGQAASVIPMRKAG